jgi:hypothetical protein
MELTVKSVKMVTRTGRNVVPEEKKYIYRTADLIPQFFSIFTELLI